MDYSLSRVNMRLWKESWIRHSLISILFSRSLDDHLTKIKRIFKGFLDSNKMNCWYRTWKIKTKRILITRRNCWRAGGNWRCKVNTFDWLLFIFRKTKRGHVSKMFWLWSDREGQINAFIKFQTSEKFFKFDRRIRAYPKQSLFWCN